MTSLELTDLIQAQLTENPVLEEVATQEEARELAEKILDHMANGGEMDPFSDTAGEGPTTEGRDPRRTGLGLVSGAKLILDESGLVRAR